MTVGREGKTVDAYFVELESVFDLSSFEIPDDDIGREAGEGILSRCNVLSVWGYFY